MGSGNSGGDGGVNGGGEDGGRVYSLGRQVDG